MKNNITINTKTNPVNALHQVLKWVAEHQNEVNCSIIFSTYNKDNKQKPFLIQEEELIQKKENYVPGKGLRFKGAKKDKIRKLYIDDGKFEVKMSCKSLNPETRKLETSKITTLMPKELYIRSKHETNEDGEIFPFLDFEFSEKHASKAFTDLVLSDEEITVEKVKNLIKIRKIGGGVWLNYYIEKMNDTGFSKFSGCVSGNNMIKELSVRTEVGKRMSTHTEEVGEEFEALIDTVIYPQIVEHIKLIKASL